MVTVRKRPASAPLPGPRPGPIRRRGSVSPRCRVTCLRKLARRRPASIRTTSHAGRASFRIRPGTPGPVPISRSGGRRLRQRGEQHQRLDHEVSHPRLPVPVGGHGADPLPMLELLEVRRDLGGKGRRECEPECPRGRAQNPLGLAPCRGARRSRARSRRLRLGGPPARPCAASHCVRSGTAGGWSGSC